MLYPSHNKLREHYLYRRGIIMSKFKWERREAKLKKRRKMKIDGKSVFVIEQELYKRATQK